MTITIGSYTYSGKTLTAQPFGYEETNTRQGLTARKWLITGLLTPTEWGNLLSTYNTWRDARIGDPDSVVSNSVGTTINLTAKSNGITWTAVPCWFISAPTSEQVGYYIQASVELVDAAQALQVAQKAGVLDKGRYYFGTWTIGSTTLQLLRPPETYQDTPNLSLTAGGETYITGPQTATRLRQIEGDTNASGWTAIQSWYESEIQTTPTAGEWFPVGAPSANAEAVIVNGIRSDIYTVSITLAQAR